jgi:hypothetical protein
LDRADGRKHLLSLARPWKVDLAAVLLDLYGISVWSILEGASLDTNGFNTFVESPRAEFVK